MQVQVNVLVSTPVNIFNPENIVRDKMSREYFRTRNFLCCKELSSQWIMCVNARF